MEQLKDEVVGLREQLKDEVMGLREQLTDEVGGLREQITGLVAIVSTLVRQGALQGPVQTFPTADSASSSANRTEDQKPTSRKHKARAEEDEEDSDDDEGLWCFIRWDNKLTVMKMTRKPCESIVRFESVILTTGMKREDGIVNGERRKTANWHEDEATRRQRRIDEESLRRMKTQPMTQCDEFGNACKE